MDASRADIAIEDYHGHKSRDYISHTAMTHAFTILPDGEWVWTPHLFKAYVSGKLNRKSSKAQEIGNVFHCLAEGVEPKVIVSPIARRGTKEWDAWIKKEADDRKITPTVLQAEYTILKENEDRKILEMYKSMKRNKIIQEIMEEGRVAVEGTVRWTDPASGLKLQARPDMETVDHIIDWKTSDEPEQFLKVVYPFSYMRQAALQIDGVRAVTGKKKRHIHAVIGKSWPFDLLVYSLPENAIQLGRSEVAEILQQIGDWEAFQTWESPWNTRVITSDIPSYHYRGRIL